MAKFIPVEPEKWAEMVKAQAENARLKAEVEQLKAVSTIEQRTIQGLQQTPEWSEIARLTAYCRELEGKVSHIDLFKSVVEKFFNSADLKNHPDAQSCYALAENLKQLPDSILDFTEEQVRDNPAWALAVFRHKVKEMQYKRCHDLNEIGGEQEENARLKAEVEQLTSDLQMEKENEDRLVREWQRANNEVYGLQRQVAALIDDQTRLKAECQARQAENSVLAVECDSLKAEVELWKLRSDNWQKFCQLTRPEMTDELNSLKAEVERLTKAGDEMHEQATNTFQPHSLRLAMEAWNAAKKGGQP